MLIENIVYYTFLVVHLYLRYLTVIYCFDRYSMHTSMVNILQSEPIKVTRKAREHIIWINVIFVVL